MKQSFVEKMGCLERIAAEDEICRSYTDTLAELKVSYDRLLRFLPRPLRRRIEGYVGYQAMLLQRKLVLACQHMDFSEPKKGNG